MKVVTADQMRRIEARSQEAGVSTDALMERAGLAVARRVQYHAGRLAGATVAVLVGPGNNGGDGLVAAHHLDDWGAEVAVYLCRDRQGPDPKLEALSRGGSALLKASEDGALQHLTELLRHADFVVDALLGTGRARPIEGALKAVMSALASARATRRAMRVVAVDLPTGLDADTGAADPVCAAADVTVALGHPKAGLFGLPGASKVGALEVVDIGLPPGLDEDVTLELMNAEWARAAIPERPPAAHKGTFGRVLLIAGSRSYLGAAHLAAVGAARTGAGLVTVALPESLVAAVAAGAAEPTYLPLAESAPGVVSADAVSDVFDNLEGYSALLIGCGLGQATSTREFVEGILYSGEPLPPTVVDADGLNILSTRQSEGDAWWERFAATAVVTPHPGEMSRLSEAPVEAIQADRVGHAVRSAALWDKIAVLKGAHTVVASPGGAAMLSPFANPGLASAGTGDVLAGAVSGLVSQGLSLYTASALGVYLHGAAGELVRKDLGDTGMIASDLLAALPHAIKGLRDGGRAG